ncbi:cyclic nucleotide-binding domain-containing protein [Actinoplanes sichuanensis]|uniref:Crp/Fnr family transcriptional regulator n=1 Tax=Actinoplanes sichuanensis TaxID=512349 RepID=A0ABW4A0V0_9ACTN|nr:cyclic nucleotide-binding domain-containing protein [Actinoplanes sichuanensis]BEL01886.1 cyclic nucleotide-binding domain-containing protein [Actinoplanes sichuanensis]
MQTTVEMLAEQPFLAGLTEHQLSLLVPLASRSMFHGGNRIFREGAPAEEFWLITDGRVYLDCAMPGYDDFVLETLRSPAVLGCSWLFPPYRWQFGAVSVHTTEVLAFNGPQMRALFQSDPSLGFELTTRFLRVMGDRLHTARRRLADCQRETRHLDDV